MYFNLTCPHCSKGLRVRDELAGKTARCPYCKNPVTIPHKQAEEPAPAAFDLLSFDPLAAPPAPTPAAAPTSRGPSTPTPKSPAADVPTVAAGAAKRVARRAEAATAMDDGTNVSLAWTGLIGLGATFIFYLILGWTPKCYFRDLFFERGWVTYAEAYLMFWAIVILLAKSRKLMRQKESMLFDLLPEDLGKDISPESLPRFVKHVSDLPVKNTGSSFLVRRVLRGLEHYSVRGSASEVASMLSSQSDLDNAAVGSSYSLLNVFIWAIPILGFIGTVQGLGNAVGSLSGSLESASDVESIKKSLGNITGGLGVAFDTTLVALIMSLFLKFPASSLQKAEEDLLNWVEEYCNENLLKRLQDHEEPATTSDAGLQKAVTAAMAPHHAELRAWSAKLKDVGKSIVEEVSQGWSAMLTDLNERQKQQLTEVQTTLSAVGETTERLAAVAGQLQQLEARELERTQGLSSAIDAREANLATRAAEHESRVEATLAEFAERAKQSAEEVAAHGAAAQTEIANAVRQSTAALENHFALLREAVVNLNEALGGLNGKQVVIEATTPQPIRKKSWFGR